jgi:hypothetical protein
MRNAIGLPLSWFRLALELTELREPPSALRLHAELGGEKGGQYLLDKLDADDLRANAQQVDIIVLHALVGGVGVVADRGANPGSLVAGDARSHAGAADEQPSIGHAAADGSADGLGDVGEVDRVRPVGANILNGVPGRRNSSMTGPLSGNPA